MPLEIERKFMVVGDYKKLATSHSRIMQGYICSGRGRTVRVRLRDDKGYLTIKGPSLNGGLSRYEFEKKSHVMRLFRSCAYVNQGLLIKYVGSCRKEIIPMRSMNSLATMQVS